MCIRGSNEYERLTSKINKMTSEEIIELKEAAIENIKDIEEISDINTFKNLIESIGDQYKNVENKSIFHYTSAEGIKSIIENRQMWFSKTDFLNDRNEIKHTYDLIERIMRGSKLFLKNQNDLIEELEQFKTCLYKALLGEAANFNITNSYSASFSMNGDSNLLWEGYSKDDGYNIEFNSKEIHSIVSKDNNLHLDLEWICIGHSVIYDEKEQISLLKMEIIDSYKIFKYCKKLGRIEEFEKIINKNIANIIIHSLFFKSPQFEQEDEYRIILGFIDDTQKNQGFKIRIRNGAFIPYIEVPICKEINEYYRMPIKSITISPKNNLDIIGKGIDYLLKLSKVEGTNEKAIFTNKIKIKKSKIPYRY